MKRNIFLVLVALFLSACTSSNLLYKSENYKQNTKVFSPLTETSRVNWSSVPGAYDEYFDIVKSVKPNYQLIYHHPGDYSADTYSYYVALVELSDKNEILQAKAVYNGKELPLATTYFRTKGYLINFKSNYVNILLTKEQLIDAYENVGKMIIPLVINEQTYNIVFPDYYLRKVLASTTNIDKYKIAEQLANPPASNPNQVNNAVVTTFRRTPFEHSANVEPPSYISSFPSQRQEERITADLKVNNSDKKFYFTISYILQHADNKDKPYLSENDKQEITYVKSFVIREKEVYNDYCYQLRTRFDTTYQKLTIQCQRAEYGGYTSIASFYLDANPKPTDFDCLNCSVVKHI